MIAQHPPIGRVFTPLSWARWLAERSGAFRIWQEGGTILDPTCGNGAFLEAFISLGLDEKGSVSSDRLSRLYGIEINPDDRDTFINRVREVYSIDFPTENFRCSDILHEQADIKADFIIGNPPWSNFADLPQTAKDGWADAFIRHGLVKSKRDVLLGKSRMDLCALIIKKTIDVNLRPNGRASLFAPLSILFNDGANNEFRPHPNSDHNYAITSVWDFDEENIFDGIATRYGAIDFATGSKQKWPVRTWVYSRGEWYENLSTSCDRKSGGWIRHDKGSSAGSAPVISATTDSKPRQGVNTCGANDVFIFRKTDARYFDSFNNIVEVEEQLLFPLMEKSIFDSGAMGRDTASKWILIPHDRRTGRALTWDELSEFPKSRAYLLQHEDRLRKRKGTMIRSNISQGRWWALLGVGRYSFSRWKVAWEALGKKVFKPVLLDGMWQGNQAMHAFCPCSTKKEAVALLRALESRDVEVWLKSFSMGGTCNWAQPGRVSRIFSFEGEPFSQI